MSITVKEIREALHMTQPEFGEALGGLSQGAISQYETGIRIPGRKVMFKIRTLAKKVGIKFSYEDIYPREE